MKLLLDQNLSFRIVAALQDEFPGSAHISSLGLGNATDSEIWNYAKNNGFTVVTFDADFHELNLLDEGPSIVWLRCGNLPRKLIVKKLLENSATIQAAESNPAPTCIELY